MGKASGKTIVKGMGFCASAIGANACNVDIDEEEGKILRIRPFHFDDEYPDEHFNAWKFEARGKTFEPGKKMVCGPLSYSYKKRVYSKNRILYPMKRVDWDPHGDRNPQNRGKSKYVRISWDEATQIIAEEIKRIHDEYGPLSILVQGDGHGETKFVHGTHGCQTRLLGLIGDYTLQARQPDSWEGLVLGRQAYLGHGSARSAEFTKQCHQRHFRKWRFRLFFWGADPETTPWGWGGMMASRLCYWFSDIGVRQIHISPDVNYTNAVHADKWIPVLPNTDAALQLAIAYVWLTEGTYDREYLDSHAIGFENFAYYVMGGEDGVPKTPKWAEKKCGVPAYTIKGARPPLGQARGLHRPLQRRLLYPIRLRPRARPPRGRASRHAGPRQAGREPVQIHRMVVIRNANGYSDASFGGDTELCSGVPRASVFGSTFDYSEDDDSRSYYQPPVHWYGHIAAGLPREDQFVGPLVFPLEGQPRLHMIWSDAPCWETCWNGGNEMQEALRHESIEFLLVQHPWMENDCLFADIILPINTKMEEEDIGTDSDNGMWSLVYYEQQAIEPLGESKSDLEAVEEIAKKLEQFGGIYEDLHARLMDGGKTVADFIKDGFENTGRRRR